MAAKQLIILLFGCLLVACNEKLIDSVQPNGETEKVPVHFYINLSATSPRAWEYDEYFPDATPTEEETKVSNVLIVAFKDVYLEEFEFFSEESEHTFTKRDDGTIFLGNNESEQNIIDLDPGVHFFYVILNTPPELYESMIKPQLESGANTLHKDDFERNILTVTLEGMTQGGDGFIMTNTDPPGVTVIYSDDQIKNNNQLSNRIYLNVGRAVAKVSLAYTPTRTGMQYGSLSNIYYQVAYNPSQMYLMPVVENNLLISPHYQGDTSSSYFSPTINNISDEDWLSATTQETDKEDMTFAYCIENSNKKALPENSTMLVIKANFHPVEWLNSDGTEGSPSNDDTYFRIAQCDANENILNYYQGYYNESPLPGEIPNNYCKVIEYPNGLCYYTLRLTDNDGNYTVKRNNFFKIAITHIHSSGEPKPDVTDPDEKNAWGRIEIWGSDWKENDQEEGLGKDPDDDETEGSVTPSPWEDEDDQEEELGGDNKFN